jgi:hypothetical protein
MGKKRNVYRLLGGNQREKDHKEDKDVGGWMTLRWILQKHEGVVWTDWIVLAQDRGRWRAFLNAVMNIRVP